VKLKQHDSITIFPEDGSRFVEVMVIHAGRGFAHVRPVREGVLAENAEDMPDDDTTMIVKFNGPHDRWTVIRRSDGEKLKTGLLNKADAQRWAADHLAAQAR
jgi:hypothetical protein